MTFTKEGPRIACRGMVRETVASSNAWTSPKGGAKPGQCSETRCPIGTTIPVRESEQWHGIATTGHPQDKGSLIKKDYRNNEINSLGW